MSAPNFPIYLTKEIQKVSAVAGVWTLTLSDVDGILVGTRVSVGGLVTTSWNVQNVAVTAVNQTAKTIRYSHSNATVAEAEVWGQAHVAVSWGTIEEVEDFLGFEAEGADADYLGNCLTASQDFCFRRRSASGYKDHPQVVPSPDVRLAVVIYAATLFREKGSVDSFTSYQNMGLQIPAGGLGQIFRLLGVNKAQIA